MATVEVPTYYCILVVKMPRDILFQDSVYASYSRFGGWKQEPVPVGALYDKRNLKCINDDN